MKKEKIQKKKKYFVGKFTKKDNMQQGKMKFL